MNLGLNTSDISRGCFYEDSVGIRFEVDTINFLHVESRRNASTPLVRSALQIHGFNMEKEIMLFTKGHNRVFVYTQSFDDSNYER